MKISISIPKPCHENWNAMTPAADAATGIGGRHCDSCQHTVMDLTRVSDAQLIDLFRKDAMPKCARFSQGQLDRVIALEADRSPRLLPAAAVGLAMAFAAPEADAQNCAPTVGKMMISRPTQVMPPVTKGEMVISRPVDVITGDTVVQVLPPQVETTVDSAVGMQVGQMVIRGGRPEVQYYIDGVKVPAGPGLPISALEALEAIEPITGGIPEAYSAPPHGPFSLPGNVVVSGRVLDESGEPAPFVSIRLGNTTVSGASDVDGRFLLSIPDSLYDRGLPLRIHTIGYATTEIPLGWEDLPAIVQQAPPYVEGKHMLTGRALLDGKPVSGCVVQVVGTNKIITVDERGFFGFDLTGDAREWTLKAVSPTGHYFGSTVVPASALPCCVPIALETIEEPMIVRPTTIDVGDIVMEPQEAMIMGEWAQIIPAKRSVLHRAGTPFRWIGRQVSRPFR